MPLKKGDVNIVLSLDSEGAVKGVKNFGKEIETTSKRAESSIGGIESALIGVGAVIGLRELKSQIIGLADEAAFAQQSMKVLGDVTEALGGDSQAAIQAAEDLGDGMFSVFDAATALRNLLAAGLELPKAIQLMETLKNSAAANRRASLTLAQQVISTTEGIRNQNSVLTDNSGITTNVNTILLKYARAHGTTVAKLDRFTQAQAIANGFIEEGAVFLGQYESQMAGYVGAQGEATVAAQELRIELGTQLHDVMADLYGQFAGWTEDITEFAKAHEGLTVEVTGAAAAIGTTGFLAGLIAVGSRIHPVTLLVAALAATIGSLVGELAGTTDGIRNWDKAVAGVKANIAEIKEHTRAIFETLDVDEATRRGATAHAAVYTAEIERLLTDNAVGLGNAIRIAWTEAEGFFPLSVPIEWEVARAPFAAGAVPADVDLPGVARVPAPDAPAVDQKALDARLKAEEQFRKQLAALVLTERQQKEFQLEEELAKYRAVGVERVHIATEIGPQLIGLEEFRALRIAQLDEATAAERAAIEKDLQDQIRALKLSAFDNDRAILADQVQALRDAEISQTAIIEFEALRRAEIRQAEADEAERLAKIAAGNLENELGGATKVISDGFRDMRHSIVNDFDSLDDAAQMIARRMFNSFVDLLFDPFEAKASQMSAQLSQGAGPSAARTILSFLPFGGVFGGFLPSLPGATPGTAALPAQPGTLPPGSQLVMEGDRNIDLRHSVIFSPDRKAGFDAVYRDQIKRSEIDHDERF